MLDGFIKIGVCTPPVHLADPMGNAGEICAMIAEAEEAHIQVLVFPELCLTGYTCGDLFWQDSLLNGAIDALA
ncbi:MAG: NAD(+) synthase, partial [Lachnospiraceae bacterium]|nr:NAD(+) synthase [Lachnospiraceae bacterium]